MKAIRRFSVRPVLPTRIAALGDLAMNLRWSWHPPLRDLFESIDPARWAAVGEDPVAMLSAVEPAELERIRAACAIADRALEDTLADIRPGVAEQELALALEWRIRTGGAEALAFDVACLSGPRAALPHGSPGLRSVAEGEVLLFDFGAQVGANSSGVNRIKLRPGLARLRRLAEPH